MCKPFGPYEGSTQKQQNKANQTKKLVHAQISNTDFIILIFMFSIPYNTVGSSESNAFFSYRWWSKGKL